MLFRSGLTIFLKDNKKINYFMAILNSPLFKEIKLVLNPSYNLIVKDVRAMPILYDSNSESRLSDLVSENIVLSKKDWDEQETSWNYTINPLVDNRSLFFLESIVDYYMRNRHTNIKKMMDNESLIYELVHKMYGVSDILRSEIDLNDCTIQPKTDNELIKELVSYAVGCMFGRYSLDTPGLCYAGGTWDSSKYSSFIPDSDNIIPINDEEYFGDDIVTYFERFIETIFGKETLEENLKYIANALEIKGSGTAREKIRKYFLNDFYKDHLQMYQKCPIYWLFDSGKANGFKALIYMHRYSPDLIGKMRQNYLLKMQRIYTEQYDKEKDQVRRTTIRKKLDEIERYDLAMELYASKNVSINLDDGVKHNYFLFQEIENSKSTKDKINLLYRI